MSTNRSIKKIAITTGGGDAPGLNAVIRAVVLSSIQKKWECYGILDGYTGLLEPNLYPDGGLLKLTQDRVSGITHLGGTILGTTNRGNPFKYPFPDDHGEIKEIDKSDDLLSAFEEKEIDALIAIGGDGSLTIADKLAQKGLRVIGVPKTIDNDLEGTVVTFGFDTAVSFATECIDRLHSTAESHHRVMIVEVMGRHAGWIALHAGISATADAILIPEIPYGINFIVNKIERRSIAGKNFSIIVIAEGAYPLGGNPFIVEKAVGKSDRLGGAGEYLASELKKLINKEIRLTVLGHLLRGGTPTTFDRLLALRFGSAAVRALSLGMNAMMVALVPPYIRYIPLSEVSGKSRFVEINHDTILTARELGICLGDQ